MQTKIIRVAQGKQSTLSQLYINDVFQCYLLEDKIREVKLPKQTAIPTGVFKLTLNTWGAKNTEYQRLWGTMHKGMIEIDNLGSFDYVYIHLGNNYKQTAGCPLCGFGFQFVNGDYEVTQSKDAYKMIYPKLAKIAKDSSNKILIENNFQF